MSAFRTDQAAKLELKSSQDLRIQLTLTEFQGVYKKLNKSESQLELERKGKAALEQEVVKLKEAQSQERCC